MPIGILFWVLMIIWAIFGVFTNLSPGFAYAGMGNAILLFVLFGLLGWQVFGPALKGPG